ncbi:MAG: hypothetical protein WBO12_05025, partial [Xanthobacteraceae bacterium]
MRVVVIVFAALMTLGLAAFGVVAAQRAAGSDSLIALAVHVISPGQSSSTATPPSQPVAAQAARPTTPVVQVAQTATAAQPNAPAPTSLAQNATAAPAPAAPAPA